MPAFQLNKIFYIKNQKVVKGPPLKPIQTESNTISQLY